MTPREEESLLEDMRAAIRADRERLAARVQPAEPPPPEPAQAPEPARPLLRRLLGR